ncbi:MAG: hypothetical protein O6926_00060, partial [candidate division NC10 bacterium]|nr:hypothetical protein [candidate division NC10 bacterium]
KVARLEGELARIARRDENIMLAFEQGAYSVEEMTARRAKAAEDRAEAEAALTEAREELTHAMADTTHVEFVVQCLEHGFDLYANNGFEGRRSLIQALLEKVVVEDRERGHFVLGDPKKWEGWLEGTAGKRVFDWSRTGARAGT